MPLVSCDFFSETLAVSTSMILILPQTARGQIGMQGVQSAERGRRPVLYLLHGLSDDHTIWQRRTSIERYVAPLGLTVVMPQVGRSYYADMHSGPRYWSFISEELPALCREWFGVSDRRQDNLVAGLSMGGYGALKLALAHPGRYAAAASLSGAVDVVERIRSGTFLSAAERHGLFGDGSELVGSISDLFAQAEKVARSKGPKPRLYAWCGTEDGLIEENRRFVAHVRSNGLPLTYEEGPGGHTWDCWDRQIQRVLDWMTAM